MPFDNSASDEYPASKVYSSPHDSMMPNENEKEQKTLHKLLEAMVRFGGGAVGIGGEAHEYIEDELVVDTRQRTEYDAPVTLGSGNLVLADGSDGQLVSIDLTNVRTRGGLLEAIVAALDADAEIRLIVGTSATNGHLVVGHLEGEMKIGGVDVAKIGGVAGVVVAAADAEVQVPAFDELSIMVDEGAVEWSSPSGSLMTLKEGSTQTWENKHAAMAKRAGKTLTVFAGSSVSMSGAAREAFQFTIS